MIHQKKLLREEAILSSLKKLDYLTRRQLQRLHDLGGERNARRILDDLSPFVSSFRDNGENIYYLSKAGRERIGCDVIRQKSLQVGHFLMRNDVFIHYRPEDWKNEVLLKAESDEGGKAITIIADAYYRYNLKRHILEVDHLQHLHKNFEKIQRYKKFKESGTFQKNLRYFPPLVWVTLTESRKKQLMEWCEGLEIIIHLWDEIK